MSDYCRKGKTFVEGSHQGEKRAAAGSPTNLREQRWSARATLNVGIGENNAEPRRLVVKKTNWRKLLDGIGEKKGAALTLALLQSKLSPVKAA